MPDEPTIEELQALSREIAAGAQSAWEPRCVARAFGSAARDGSAPLRLTMQGWIDLEDIQSPLLQGEVPGTFDGLSAAAAAFGMSVEEHSPDEAISVAVAMRAAVTRAFSMILPMRPEKGEPAPSHGFGEWLPILACLIAECGESREAALAYPVEQAFAVIAATRHNQGWREAGEPYASREVPGASCLVPGSEAPVEEEVPRA